MSEPLQDSDPRQLGAFRLRERTSVGTEGIVYLAHDSAGRAVSVAVLSEGAAADPAARDRFVAAVARGAGVQNPPRVLASNTSNPAASWVAVPHSDDAPGAGAFLEPVAVEPAGGTRRSPGYVPYWAGARAPASGRWSWQGGGGSGAAAADPRATRAVIAGLVVLLLLLVALLVVLYMWLAQIYQQATAPPAQPGPSPTQEESGQEEEEEASPEEAEPEQGQDETAPPSPSPVESPTGHVPTVPLEEEDREDLPEDPEGLH
ncbi:hypothetical protein [Allosalinactinospora lopnorensis]|uniref:hypothetical protein n=1 Tax=Allosalinactinospora lopnorensis TaxID=1352348 RepID=UPI000623C2A0|nr:hypothetical protein [Allosalinactinospora lopnorensis]